MADANLTTISPSRRGALFYGSAFVASAVLAKPLMDAALDAIAIHKEKRQAFEAFCHAHDEPNDQPEYGAISDAEWAAWDRVCTCEPQTVHGAAEMARYVVEHATKCGYIDEGQTDALAAIASGLAKLA